MPDEKDTWRYRRRFMLAAVSFCMAVVVYVLWKGTEGAVAETAISMSFICLISIVGSYVFGATWDDKNARTPGPR